MNPLRSIRDSFVAARLAYQMGARPRARHYFAAVAAIASVPVMVLGLQFVNQQASANVQTPDTVDIGIGNPMNVKHINIEQHPNIAYSSSTVESENLDTELVKTCRTNPAGDCVFEKYTPPAGDQLSKNINDKGTDALFALRTEAGQDLKATEAICQSYGRAYAGPQMPYIPDDVMGACAHHLKSKGSYIPPMIYIKGP